MGHVPMTSRHHKLIAEALLCAKPNRDSYETSAFYSRNMEWIRCVQEIILTMERDSQAFNKLKFLKIILNEKEQIDLKGVF